MINSWNLDFTVTVILVCSHSCSGWGILIFNDSSVTILSLVFHSSFMQCHPLGSSYLVGRILSMSL